MAREVELASSFAAPAQIPALGEEAILSFFEDQLRRQRLERERLERSSRGFSPTKWNRQELHLDTEQRQRAMAASREHLAKHPEWFQGNEKMLSHEELYSMVALQHFLQVDLDDLSLPSNLRRSEDTFGGANSDVAEQFLLDGPRSTFCIDGEVLDFAREAMDLKGDHERVDRLQVQFVDRLVVAVQKCLGDARLLPAVTTTLSQSGLANVERSITMAQVAVSGGEQQLRYSLASRGPSGPWDMDLMVRKAGFEQVIVCGQPIFPVQGVRWEESTPLGCSPASSISKSCSIRYSLTAAGTIEVDARDMQIIFHILDRHGRVIPGFAPPKRGRLCQRLRAMFSAAGNLTVHCCGNCCSFCNSASGRCRLMVLLGLRARPERDK